MRIGEVSKHLGVSQETIRRLERRGLIAAKRDWVGHRRFTEDDLLTIRGLLFQESQNRKLVPGAFMKREVGR